MEEFDHGLPENPYNKHAWILGEPEIGERVWIGAFCLIDALRAPLKIGRGTDISSGAQVLTHSTVIRSVSEKRHGEVDVAPTEIGEFCFIGTNAVILKGCKIGHHSVIGAGAVVPENTIIPPYSLVVGVPAKVIGSSKKFLRGVEKESVSVVIPAYNERKTIESVTKEALDVLDKLKIDYEIVLVDDGSIDGTGKVIDKLARNKRIRAVHHKTNKGFTGAIKTSLYSAKKHLVFLAPADGQFNFTELESFIDAIRGSDVAIGYRVEKYKNLFRRINSWGFHFLGKVFLDIPFKEFSSVLMARRRVLESIEITSKDRSAMFLLEFFHKAVKLKYKFVEVPIHWRKRRGGEPKASGIKALKIITNTFSEILKMWWRFRNNKEEIEKKRIIFIGGRDRGLKCIETLVKKGEKIIHIFCLKEDEHEKEKYSGEILKYAKQMNIPSTLTKSVKAQEFIDQIRSLGPDLIIVMGWRTIIPSEILKIPELGCVAVHESLLPKYRGFAPVNWAIINGEKETGVSLFFLDEGIDSGDIIDQKVIQIGPNDSAPKIYKRTLKASINILIENLDAIKKGDVERHEQDHELATYTSTRIPEDGQISWNNSALEIHNFVRALSYPYPGAFTLYKGEKVIIQKASMPPQRKFVGGIPGRVVSIGSGWVEALTGDGIIRIEEVVFDKGKIEKASQRLTSIKGTLGR